MQRVYENTWMVQGVVCRGAGKIYRNARNPKTCIAKMGVGETLLVIGNEIFIGSEKWRYVRPCYGANIEGWMRSYDLSIKVGAAI